MTIDEALAELGLTGSGTTDSLTVDLATGSQVTITKQDVAAFPDAPLRSTVVVLDGVPFESRYAVGLMRKRGPILTWWQRYEEVWQGDGGGACPG
jgi:hypothetical protein